MTPTLRIVLVAASLLTVTMIIGKIRESAIRIDDSIFWIAFSILLLLFSVFPQIPEFLSELVGTMTTANFIYIFIIFILIMRLFRMTIKLSQLEAKVRGLAQEIAIDRNADEKEKKN